MIGKIIPVPLLNICDGDGAKKWAATGVPAHLDLKLNTGAIPSGWVLFEGKLVRRAEDFTAYLIVETKTKNASSLKTPLPTTPRGVFSEIIYLPKDVTRIVLEPMQSKGEFELLDFTLKSVGWLEKNFRMFCRVMAFYKKYSFEFCHRSGLRFHMPFLHISEAYRIVSRFKYFAPPPNYAYWLKEFDVLSAKERLLIKKQISGWANRPHFEIVLTLNEINKDLIQQTIDSLGKQFFRKFSVTLLVMQNSQIDNLSVNFPEWVEITAQGTLSVKWQNRKELKWMILVEPGMVFEDNALYWFASIIVKDDVTQFIYSDHDYINQDGLRCSPVFKPDWSPELLRSTNYIGSSVTTIRSDVLCKVVNISELNMHNFDYHDLFLRISEQVKNRAIRHVPAILGHVPEAIDQHDQFLNTKINPVISHLKRLDISATVEAVAFNRNRIIYHLPENQPLISLVIPTRNALFLLKPCIESILKLSSYQNYELIVVDNQSDDQETLDYLDDLKQNSKVRVLRYDQPFNYSAINNFAVKESLGEVLCLLNNDTEVISAGWLEEMLGHLIQKDVGVVGAKLYYSDGRVQHAGDAVGPGGCASHLHSMIERDSPGYCNRAVLAQDLSAVTAACLMTWRKVYLQVGGLDQKNLAVAFNDVDYCLKVRESGYRIIWTPYAELYHYESVSRGQNNTSEKVKRSRNEANYIRKRWKHIIHHDPFYNPNLSYQRPDFSLSYAPMVTKPWTQSWVKRFVKS